MSNIPAVLRDALTNYATSACVLQYVVILIDSASEI